MTREDVENCFPYNAAGAAMEFYEQEHSQSSRIDSDDVVNAFEAGAEWAQKFMIKRACEWLENNFVCFLQVAKRGIYSNQFATVQDMVDNFKKAMEE